MSPGLEIEPPVVTGNLMLQCKKRPSLVKLPNSKIAQTRPLLKKIIFRKTSLDIKDLLVGSKFVDF